MPKPTPKYEKPAKAVRQTVATLAHELRHTKHEVAEMSQTIDELKATVQAFVATLTADVAANTAAIADLKSKVTAPVTVDFQPELDAANAQLAALEAATANAKS
jgi:predicted RNase H-like nuclease (RuvC/YqgF family)